MYHTAIKLWMVECITASVCVHASCAAYTADMHAYVVQLHFITRHYQLHQSPLKIYLANPTLNSSNLQDTDSSCAGSQEVQLHHDSLVLLSLKNQLAIMEWAGSLSLFYLLIRCCLNSHVSTISMPLSSMIILYYEDSCIACSMSLPTCTASILQELCSRHC